MGTTDLELAEIYDSLTEKQLETLDLVGEGHTSKVIAARLDISAHAANERISVLRKKFGNIPKAELGRIHRKTRENFPPEKFGGQFSQLPPTWTHEPSDGRHRDESDMVLADCAPVFRLDAPWSHPPEPHVVPEVLDGEDASRNRWVATIAIAIGMLVLAVVLLAAAQAIGTFFG